MGYNEGGAPCDCHDVISNGPQSELSVFAIGYTCCVADFELYVHLTPNNPASLNPSNMIARLRVAARHEGKGIIKPSVDLFSVGTAALEEIT